MPGLPEGFELESVAPADDPSLTPDQLPSQQPEAAGQRRQLAEYAKVSDDKIWSLIDRVDKIARPVVRGVTETAEGVLALPKLVADLPANLINRFAGTNIPRFSDQPSLTQAAVGAPKTEAERIGGNIARGVGGALTTIGAGSSLANTASGVTREVGRTLAANPALQTTGAVTSVLSGEAAREAGLGQVGQTVASLAGGVAPSLAAAAGPALVRGTLRGGEAGRQTVERNIQTFERAGTTPSVGQATESRVNRAAETLLSRAPGGAGQIAKKATNQADELATRIEQNASRLAGKTSAETTGRKISAAIEGDFVPKFRARQRQLYNELDNLIPPDSAVGVNNTQGALKELTKLTQGAEATTARLVNPQIKAIAEALKTDAQTGTVPYSALKDLRTRVGEQLESGLVSDVPAKQWKRLYAALSQDMEAAAAAAGPQAQKAFSRANGYTKAGMQRLEVLDGVLQKNGGPEAVFKAAMNGTTEGATTLRAVMRSLDENGRKAVSATVLRRLGRAVNSQQDELGEKFSTETFLTNWNKISPEAKKELFDRFGPQYSKDIEALSKVASNLREGSQVFKNPSGTGQAATQAGTVGAFALSVLTGRLDVAAGIAAGAAASNLSARLMTNPRFVRWLAVSTKMPKSALTSQINGLAQVAEQTDDQELREAVELMREGSGPTNNQEQRATR